MSGRFATVSHFFFYLGVSGRVAHDPSRSPEFHYTLVRRARTLSYAPRRAAPRPPTNQRLVNGAHWGASRTHSATRAQGFHIPPRLGSHGLRQVPPQTQRGVATIGLTPRTFSIARGFTERLRKRSIISRRESRRGSSLEKILRKRSIISRCEGFVAERYFGSESFRVARVVAGLGSESFRVARVVAGLGSESFRVARHDGFVAEKDTSEAKCYFASRRGSSLKDTSEAKYHFASRGVVAGFGSEVSFRVARGRRWLRKRSAISRRESRRGSSLASEAKHHFALRVAKGFIAEKDTSEAKHHFASRRARWFIAEKDTSYAKHCFAWRRGFVAEKDTSEAKCHFASRGSSLASEANHFALRGSSLASEANPFASRVAKGFIAEKDTSEAKHYFAPRRVRCWLQKRIISCREGLVVEESSSEAKRDFSAKGGVV